MNFKLCTIVSIMVLLSSLTALASGVIEKSDLFSASESVVQGQNYVLAGLTESGKAKIKGEAVGSTFAFNLGGTKKDLKLRVPIVGDRIQLGPFDKNTAEKIISEINGK